MSNYSKNRSFKNVDQLKEIALYANDPIERKNAIKELVDRKTLKQVVLKTNDGYIRQVATKKGKIS